MVFGVEKIKAKLSSQTILIPNALKYAFLDILILETELLSLFLLQCYLVFLEFYFLFLKHFLRAKLHEWIL